MFGNRRDPGLSREFVGAWMVTLVVGVFGLIVTSHHVPDVRDRVVVPQWYDPPVAGGGTVGEWGARTSWRRCDHLTGGQPTADLRRSRRLSVRCTGSVARDRRQWV